MNAFGIFPSRSSPNPLMTNVLIVLTLPQAVRMQYFDHVKKHFPEVRLDMVERPLIRHDETMTIQKNMNMVCHPTNVTERTYSWCCDNFLIGDSGVAEKLHKFP